MKLLVVPAIIAKTQTELDKMLDRVRGKVRRVMVDVMDGKFVNNTSLDFDFKLPAGLEYEAHLMVKTPLDWVRENANKVDIAVLHVETLENTEAAVDYVKSKMLKVVLAMNPETSLDAVLPYLDEIHGILVMTVNPGSFCIEFLPETLEKVKKLREIDKTIPIEVDGCMNPQSIGLARRSGANSFASGSYIFESQDVGKAIKELEDATLS